jgi:hypothetical protein
MRTITHEPYSGSTKQFFDGFEIGDVRIAGNKKQALAVNTQALKLGMMITRKKLPGGRYALRRLYPQKDSRPILSMATKAKKPLLLYGNVNRSPGLWLLKAKGDFQYLCLPVANESSSLLAAMKENVKKTISSPPFSETGYTYETMSAAIVDNLIRFLKEEAAK